MTETRHFANDGFGWTCKRCRDDSPPSDELSSPDGETPDATSDAPDERLPRFFREGEAEEREPAFAEPALARRRDTADGRRLLVCPVCGAQDELT
ncbi:MAG TPA: hypothetical protein VER32_07970 [Pyrinomonadaceae bacterium]|nr:hypothetical protein [Pyrinomonadaceae bacterium]